MNYRIGDIVFLEYESEKTLFVVVDASSDIAGRQYQNELCPSYFSQYYIETFNKSVGFLKHYHATKCSIIHNCECFRFKSFLKL